MLNIKFLGDKHKILIIEKFTIKWKDILFMIQWY